MRRVVHVFGYRPRARKGAVAPELGQIGAREHLDHALDLARLGPVDSNDLGVGFGGPDHADP